jgi:hypothetical protein
LNGGPRGIPNEFAGHRIERGQALPGNGGLIIRGRMRTSGLVKNGLGPSVAVDVPTEEGNVMGRTVPTAHGGKAGIGLPEQFPVVPERRHPHGSAPLPAEQIPLPTVVTEVANDDALDGSLRIEGAIERPKARRRARIDFNLFRGNPVFGDDPVSRRALIRRTPEEIRALVGRHMGDALPFALFFPLDVERGVRRIGG